MMQARTSKADNVITMLPNLKERFKTLVGNLANIPLQQVDKAREVLKSLLGATITLHPCDGVIPIKGNLERMKIETGEPLELSDCHSSGDS